MYNLRSKLLSPDRKPRDVLIYGQFRADDNCDAVDDKEKEGYRKARVDNMHDSGVGVKCLEPGKHLYEKVDSLAAVSTGVNRVLVDLASHLKRYPGVKGTAVIEFLGHGGSVRDGELTFALFPPQKVKKEPTITELCAVVEREWKAASDGDPGLGADLVVIMSCCTKSPDHAEKYSSKALDYTKKHPHISIIAHRNNVFE